MKTTQKFETLKELPSWSWPEDAGRTLLEVLEDRNAPEREIAAELAGDTVVIDDGVALALLSLVENPEEPEELRGIAAIALGPVLELCDWTDDEDSFEQPPLSKQVFSAVTTGLRKMYEGETVPKIVRRRALEASIRAPQAWHKKAVRTVYQNGDSEWKLTAVFCMEYIKGFPKEILESLDSEDDEVHCHAVYAAGNWKLGAAWDHVKKLALDEKADRDLRLAAIEAVASIDPENACLVLEPLTDDEDEDIADTASEALAMTGAEDEFF
ncbi:MAG: HEAT repeat domain-containing protein [Armatimonadetes bacterium]|nr:HEAT repeat domain-containing protein [Armatimonadota bacterium]